MREGLRSSVKLLAKTDDSESSPCQATVKMDVDSTEEKGFNSSNGKSPKLIGSLTEEDKLVSAPKEEAEMNQIDGSTCGDCGAWSDTDEDITDDRRKRNRINYEGECEDDSVKKLKVKDDAVDGKLQVVGRILRSGCTVKSGGGKKAEGGQSNDGFVGNLTRRDVFEDNGVNVQKEDTVHFDIRDSYLSGNMMRKKIVYKRGRPPKSLKSKFQQKWGDVAKEAIEQSAGRASVKKLKRKRGRPPKVLENYESEKWGGMEKEMIGLSASQASCQKKNKEIENLKPRRGRPPKAQGSDLSEKRRDALEDEEVNKSAGRESNQPNNEARKKNLKRKRGRPPKVRDNYELLPAKEINCSDDDKEEGKTKKKAEKMSRRRLQRQTVRDKIVELLLGAGWEIQYRPRNGREYKDAVYVNPEGRTHWSVTLAYRVLKKQYEDSEGNSNTSKSGFKFTPVPEEELSILTKVMTKERSDKNKKKKKWNQQKGEKTTEIVTERKKWKLHKRKLGAVPGVNFKKLKRRTKLKTMHRRENDSTCTTAQGAAVSVRDHKRLEAHCRKRCALMVRNSQDGMQSETDGYVLYDGKQTVLAWMIGLGTVQLDEEVHYLKRRKTRAVLRGRITTDGIQCDCCSKTFTIAEFEAHAGGKSCQPFKNIYLETGASLFQCQLDSWNKQDESSRKGFHFVDIDGEDPNDDTCGICGDGGDLICCDGCPSTFHQSCLGIKKFPSGLWHCMFCLCKFCGMACGNMRQRDDDNASPLLALLACCFCEEKYHRSCAQVKDTMSDDPDSSSFCGKKCQELYKRLHMLFGVKHDLDEGFSWTFLRRFDVGPDVSLSGMPQKVECNSKLAVALHIMDECFLPMVDHRSGVNLIHNIVYNFGSNFNRLNYSGFFTAILERGDEIIAAASIRIHGNHLAEMPFIGTRYMYRRQGMCRRLLSAIEMALCSLNIEKLVIPAVSELRETWTSVFGFKPLEGMSKKILRNMNMLVFPGVDMLQKPLLNHQFPGENMNPIEGLETTESGEVHTTENMTNNFVGRSSAEFDLKGSIETVIPHSCGMINELAAIEPVSLLTDGCLNDTSEVAIRSANTTECRELGVNSDNLDGRIENIVKSHDAANDKQCGNEMVNNSDERYPGGFDLEDCSENSLPHSSNIIGESALVESVSLLPDGCLNDTSDVTTRSANPTKCHESGLTSGNPDKRNESNVKPHDSSHNTDEQMGNKMISNSYGRSSTGFDLKGSNYASNMIGEHAAFEHDSVFLDGCLNDTSISIQGVNNTKCQVQQRVTSDILDGESKNIMNPHDSLCKVCKESEGEMINNSNGSDSAGFDLKSSSETNVIGEPAAAESFGLPDGCLNEASDLIIQERNKITCHDHSGTVSHNLDGINENIGSCPDSLCDAYEQVAKVTGQQNSLSASIIPPTDNALQELHVQLNNASEVGIQFSAESLIGSEAASHLGEFPRASSGGAENVSCEVKIEVSNVEHNPDSVGEDSMHMTAQIISSQSQDLATEYGVNVSDENAVLHESDTGVISCDGVKSTSSEACPRAQDALNVFFPALPVEQNFNSCQRNGPDGQETEIVAMDNVMASDVIVKPNSHGCMNNAICMSREVASSSCGDGVYGLKDMSATTQSDAISLDGVLISGKAHVNNKLLKPPGSGSELDCASVTQSNSESMCSSSSASGVALHCASGGINSCSAPDVIMLSNQAN